MRCRYCNDDASKSRSGRSGTLSRFFGRFIPRRERPDKSWSLTDCISFVVMRDRDIRSALTADGDFEQAGFRALLRE